MPRHNQSQDFKGSVASGWTPEIAPLDSLIVMKIGTRSVLFGAHQFLIHPWFVVWAWWRLYGFPWDPRLWVAFFVHDIGYLGKPNMDGVEGERHPEVGARIMSLLFDDKSVILGWSPLTLIIPNEYWPVSVPYGKDFLIGPWGRLCLFHSRFYSRVYYNPPSRLCFADKLAISLTPWWLYIPMVVATGEIKEYRKHERPLSKNYKNPTGSHRVWYESVQKWVVEWVDEHKDGKEDLWTPLKNRDD